MWPFDPRGADDARRIVKSQHEGDRIDDGYAKSVASFEIEHDCYKRDFTRPQWDRWLLFIRAENGGFDVSTAASWRWLVATGRWTP